MRLVLSLIALCLGLSAKAQLPSEVDQALRVEQVSSESVSAWVYRLDDKQLLLTHQATTSRNPASVMKLLPAYAALEMLTPSFRWSTQFYSLRPVQAGKLSDGLWIKGSGSPSLNDADLRDIANELKQKWGISEICCDLVFDTSAYAKQSFNAATFDNKPYRAYNAPAEAIMLNLQSIRLEFSPLNGLLRTAVFPDLVGLKKKIDVQLVQEDCDEWKNRLQIRRDGDSLTIQGSYPLECGEKYIDIYWQDGQDYFARGFQTAWQSTGGKGLQALKLRQDIVPDTALLLHTHFSRPLADIVRDMNKTSNNVAARAVYLALSRYADATQPASYALAEKALRSWIKSKDWNFDELVLENGAGLSRVERISAEHLGLILQTAFNSSVMPELIASLPVYGLDGTLKTRSDAALYAKAHLKTGSLEQVRAVAGYMLDAKGRRCVVVWLVNGAKAQQSKPAQEAMLNWIYQHQ